MKSVGTATRRAMNRMYQQRVLQQEEGGEDVEVEEAKQGKLQEGGAPEGGGGVEGAEEGEERLLWSRLLPVPSWMPLGLRDLDQDRAVKIPPGKKINNFLP